jgi:hypothetical protein
MCLNNLNDTRNEFKSFLDEKLSSTRGSNAFCGISKKEFPKWSGWKIISEYQEMGVSPSDINDKRLDILVENYYYVFYIEEMIFS